MPKALPVVDASSPVCCAPVSEAPIGHDDAVEVATRLKSLADPVRIRLMSLLLTADAGEMRTGDLASAVGVAESTTSHHLGRLREAGMIESERRGMSVFHRARGTALDALRAALDPNCCR
ncbi:MAG TPA: winged helix-turn-helix transcriptional regulator [Actinomycetales bacterium]|nr:winged helix-turn-helix transcriptional regulator [Actinomycetales bacterium]